ncbi:MAG: protein-methionine-sulfoxide reductase heme-binding subunit MsrQ [Pelolinea sp.]|nr:protein-methionine-sulfoxide reductase heme-binding subunit MsrQ [Pelolinea sp.]
MKITRIQIITNTISALPAAALILRLTQGNLSANPIQAMTILTGRTAVYLLLISLFCTPLFNILNMSMFIQIRKTTGLFAFYYSLFHFLIFSVLDYQLNFAWILPEIKQKPFLQIGFGALILLGALAITSIQSIKKSLGKWWARIHRLVYVLASLIMIHISLASKGDIIDPIILISVFLFAMVWRIPLLQNIHLQRQPKWARDLNTFLSQ